MKLQRVPAPAVVQLAVRVEVHGDDGRNLTRVSVLRPRAAAASQARTATNGSPANRCLLLWRGDRGDCHGSVPPWDPLTSLRSSRPMSKSRSRADTPSQLIDLVDWGTLPLHAKPQGSLKESECWSCG